MTHLTQRSNRVFLSAQTKAKELEDEFIDSEHLLHGLLADGEIYKLHGIKKYNHSWLRQKSPRSINEEVIN